MTEYEFFIIKINYILRYYKLSLSQRCESGSKGITPPSQSDDNTFPNRRVHGIVVKSHTQMYE